jgi:hypothetical protein|tara:strand:+ start:2509 stop:2661 length:153 start_codon:yes stop_codon:yes gene_type:complete
MIKSTSDQGSPLAQDDTLFHKWAVLYAIKASIEPSSAHAIGFNNQFSGKF